MTSVCAGHRLSGAPPPESNRRPHPYRSYCRAPLVEGAGKPPSGGAAALESIHSRVRDVPLSKHGRKTTRDHGVLIMRKLIAWVFMYSLDGLLADEGTEYWQFCFGLPVDPAELEQKIGVYQSAYAHIMGRAAYEGMAGALPTADHPFSAIMNAARMVVFSRTLRTAEWANTTIAAGDTTEEIDKLRRGGDGHIVVWGGVSLWRSLMRLDLVSRTEFSNGTVGLHYRRHR